MPGVPALSCMLLIWDLSWHTLATLRLPENQMPFSAAKGHAWLQLTAAAMQMPPASPLCAALWC